MATGDTQDMVGRIRSVLPARWFPLTAPGQASATPVLDGVLYGLASAWAWLYGMIAYANLQTRLATATDVWLDLIALDFLGTTLQRLPGVTDAQYRLQIQQAILAPKGTRAAAVQALTNLTGRAPAVFEPANSSDTGGYSIGGVGYGAAGGYGDLQLPFQCFINAYRPHGGGVATVAGYTSFAPGSGEPGAPSSTGASTIAVTMAIPAPFSGANVYKCAITGGSGSQVAGFYSRPEVSGTRYLAAIYVWIPLDSPLTSAAFQCELNGSNVVQWTANIAAKGAWQQIGQVFNATGGMANLVLRVSAPVNGAVIYAACARFDVNGYPLPAPGGYGSGAVEYAGAGLIQGQITDAMIQAAVFGAMPASTIAWMSIAN